MLRVCYFLAAVLFLCPPMCASARQYSSAGSAPADEYFGPQHHSILDIRNRLRDLDRKSDEAMLAPNVFSGLDDLEVSLADWQHRYASDPWLPRMFAHLLHEYQRADDISSPRAMTALALMRSAYPDALETSQTVASIYGSTRSAEWARFDASRNDRQSDDSPPWP